MTETGWSNFIVWRSGDDTITPLSPDDVPWRVYEAAVFNALEEIAEEGKGSVEYDVKLTCDDGSYQMDVVMRMSPSPPLGEVVVLVDAKDRKRVERDDILALALKVRKCNADLGPTWMQLTTTIASEPH